MKDPFSLVNDSTLRLTSFDKYNRDIEAGISTRHGGYSTPPYATLNMGLHVNDKEDTVIKNREYFGELNNIPLDNWIYAEQIHHNKVVKVSTEMRGSGARQFSTSISGADGLYTKDPGIVLTAGYADCVPLFFYVPSKKLVGIAHAGWKGTVTNIGKSLITEWVEKEGIDIKDIYCGIGPSICGQCYEVNEQVIDKVDQVMPKVDKKVYQYTENGKYVLDLKQLNKELLLFEGVPSENIHLTAYCTSCHNDLFFSHRMEGGKTGRLMAYITIKA